MAYYLVTARTRPGRLEELRTNLAQEAFRGLRPFGQALTESLRNARVRPDGMATWEEEDYCIPPLAQERAAVLDTYFEELVVQAVSRGEGWAQIEALPRLFPDLQPQPLA